MERCFCTTSLSNLRMTRRPHGLQEMSYWMKEVRDAAETNVSIMVVGNKSDLKSKRKVAVD